VLFERLRAFFRPEFLNRIDETLIFRPLGREHLRKVVDIQLRHLEKLLGERRVSVELDDAAKNHIVELGYDPALGARPVKRTILRKIQDPLAEMLLNSALPDGSTICVTLDGEELKFAKKNA
jgi:ATP-dependent Clp protease ATP-binding subunit ClpB